MLINIVPIECSYLSLGYFIYKSIVKRFAPKFQIRVTLKTSFKQVS